MNKHNLGRRQTLKYLGILAGTAAGQEFLAAWLPSAAEASEGHGHHAWIPPADPSQAVEGSGATTYSPRFFEPEEFKTVEILTELIIPSDDTPGAKEAQVARYIDFVVFAAAEFRPSLQTEWKQGLILINRLSREAHQHGFNEIPASAQESLLTSISAPERSPSATHAGYEFYQLAKDMTVEGFFTSRVGLIDMLGYKGLSVLSEFPGCTHPEHQA
jgi:gluconate 2-dehydrogenase gamma chain